MSTSPPSCASDEVARKLAVVRERIAAAGGDVARVRILAVTKGFGLDAVQAAVEVGLVDVGENYASELVAKAEGWGAVGGGVLPPPNWHFLGAVQRNKVSALAPHVRVWQSVAREAEGARIARFAPGASVMVEVEATGLAGRNGCPPEAVPDLVARLRGLGLDVQGLMTVAAPGHDPAVATFGLVAQLADDLGLAERSMGMSDDLEAAVTAGTTMVRIGRALFGARPDRERGAPTRGAF